jgi:3-hydroxyacyl-CoA dehydrogenase
MTVPRLVAILGAGEIGSGWAALFAAHGARVRIVDPDPAAAARAQTAVEIARAFVPYDDTGTIEMTPSARDAADGAEWVQESLPEQLELKRAALAELDGHVAPEAIIASSTSSLTATALAEGRVHASRVLVAHPLHPVYVVPVVELCAGRATDPAVVRAAADTLRALGREPVIVRREVPGLVANRLTAALLREAFDLVAHGVVDPTSLDRIVARGIATGWAVAGPLAAEAIGAGGKGLETYIERFEAPLTALWRSIASWTALDASLRSALFRAARRGAVTRGAPEERVWADAIARIVRAEAVAAGAVTRSATG